MFLEFDHDLWLRVHLGIYGAWDFAGDILGRDERVGQRPHGADNQRGTFVEGPTDTVVLAPQARTRSPRSARPRRTRLRMSEQREVRRRTRHLPAGADRAGAGAAAHRPIVADLRGPTACEVQTADQVQAIVDKLGPDPLVDDRPRARSGSCSVVRKKPTPIALLLMDQSVVSGIGNVYRAEMLFRARQNPFTPGREVPEELVRHLWRDWVNLLRIGVETGQMFTMDDLDPRRPRGDRQPRRPALGLPAQGRPCRVCGTPIAMEELGGRKLYWCPYGQA